MKHTTKRSFTQLQGWHILVVLSLLVLTLLGQMPDSQAGWLASPPQPPRVPTVSVCRKRQRPTLSLHTRLRSLWQYLTRSWVQPVLRSLFLAVLWFLSGCRGPVVIIGWPWLLWLWQAAAGGWPELGHQPLWCAGRWLLWQGQRLLLVGYVGLALYQLRPVTGEEIASGKPASGLLLGLGCQQCGKEEPWVEVTCRDDGSYQATLCGHFTLQVGGDDPYRARLLMLFLRLLEVPGQHRGSRRTRDGRTPFVRQMQVAEWF
jgi:hypothetical protein